MHANVVTLTSWILLPIVYRFTYESAFGDVILKSRFAGRRYFVILYDYCVTGMEIRYPG